jgi:hypothetical protein
MMNSRFNLNVDRSEMVFRFYSASEVKILVVHDGGRDEASFFQTGSEMSGQHSVEFERDATGGCVLSSVFPFDY